MENNEDAFYKKQREIVKEYSVHKLICIVMFILAILSTIVGFLLFYKIIYIHDDTMYAIFFIWAVVPCLIYGIFELCYLFTHKSEYIEAKIHISEKY